MPISKAHLRRVILGMLAADELFEAINPREITSPTLREAFLRMQTAHVEGRKCILELTRPSKTDRRVYQRAIAEEEEENWSW